MEKRKARRRYHAMSTSLHIKANSTLTHRINLDAHASNAIALSHPMASYRNASMYTCDTYIKHNVREKSRIQISSYPTVRFLLFFLFGLNARSEFVFYVSDKDRFDFILIEKFNTF